LSDRGLPLRARIIWWLLTRADRAASWLRFQAVRIWRSDLERKRRARPAPPLWETWFYGDDGACVECGVNATEAERDLEACPRCGYEGRSISVG